MSYRYHLTHYPLSAKSFGGKMAISAIVGGTASRLGGGKFANGAVSAAFVHMYNAMSHPTYPSKENFIEGVSKDVSRAYKALSMMVRSQSEAYGARGLSSLSYSQAYDRVLRIEANSNMMGGILLAGTAGLLLAPVAEAGYMYAMANPIQTIGGVGFLDNAFLGGTAPANLLEGVGMVIHDYNPWAVK